MVTIHYKCIDLVMKVQYNKEKRRNALWQAQFRLEWMTI